MPVLARRSVSRMNILMMSLAHSLGRFVSHNKCIVSLVLPIAIYSRTVHRAPIYLDCRSKSLRQTRQCNCKSRALPSASNGEAKSPSASSTQQSHINQMARELVAVLHKCVLLELHLDVGIVCGKLFGLVWVPLLNISLCCMKLSIRI